MHSSGRLGFVVAVVLFDMVSHCSPDWLRTHYVALAGLEFTEILLLLLLE